MRRPRLERVDEKKEKVAANTSGANAVRPLQLLTIVTEPVTKSEKKCKKNRLDNIWRKDKRVIKCVDVAI